MPKKSVTADDDVESSELPESSEFARRFPRRLLFATAAAGVATTVAATSAAPAEAASGTTAWQLGGNASVAADGSNFLGPTGSGVNLIFKTKANSSSPVAEKMRLTAAGRLGLGPTNPAARVDASSSSVGVQGVSTNTGSDGRGVVGVAPAGYGVEGRSTDGYGVEGSSANNVGVYGTGAYAGVYAVGTSYAVIGSGGTYGSYFNGSTVGVYASGPTAITGSGSNIGVAGSGTTGVQGSGTTGVYGSGTTGVSGASSDPNGNAVYGNGGQYGVHGVNGRTAGARGDSGYVGVWGEAPSYGVNAVATATSGQNYGIFAQTNSSAGFAVFAQGNAHVNGTLSKVAGSFKIDHPLDPTNKWLSHSFVESPDMMNVYNGNVTTDARGTATVALPSYFGALNRDFRYQLTVIGDFAQAVVSQEVSNNSFGIKTDKPNVKVSWQVTGIRQDDYANEHPIVVEAAKTAPDAGARQFVPTNSRAKQAQNAPATPNDSITPPAPAAAPTVKAPDGRKSFAAPQTNSSAP